jgi:hypothetical protein
MRMLARNLERWVGEVLGPDPEEVIADIDRLVGRKAG